MKGKNSLLWVLSVFLLLCALGALLSSGVSGFFVLLSAIGCNPLFLKQLEKYGKKPKKKILIPVVLVLFFAGMATTPTPEASSSTTEQVKELEVSDTADKSELENSDTTASATSDTLTNKTKQSASTEQVTSTDTSSGVQPTSQEATTEATNNISTIEYKGATYNIITVDGGDKSGSRQANVAVDIGYGDRVYWAYTNEFGQLVNVTADQVILQDDTTEPVNSDGRYYDDEAEVQGTEQDDLDQGHVIADSLGGVSNAYNITPQNSTLNRNGDQAYMEKVIRDADGCEGFVATITYPDTTTQIPSHYHYEYVLKGENIVDDFDNVNPDEVNKTLDSQSSNSATGSTNGSGSSNNSTSVAAVASTESGSNTNTQDTTVVEQTNEVTDNTDNNSLEVHITKTGECYHSAGCQYLSRSDIIVTLEQAKAKGLRACSKCNPPQ